MTIEQPVEPWETSIDVAVVVASLGGLAAIETLLGDVDAAFPVPLVVVQHRRAVPDLAPEILQRKLSLPVTGCRSGAELRGPGVFVLPPRGELEIGEQRRVCVRGSDRANADQVLQTVANTFGARSLAVVLTGRHSDGARGVTALKRAGGRVLVQDPAEARAAGMPKAALATGNVDFVLPLRYLTFALIALAVAPGAADMLRVAPPSWASIA